MTFRFALDKNREARVSVSCVIANKYCLILYVFFPFAYFYEMLADLQLFVQRFFRAVARFTCLFHMITYSCECFRCADQLSCPWQQTICREVAEHWNAWPEQRSNTFYMGNVLIKLDWPKKWLFSLLLYDDIHKLKYVRKLLGVNILTWMGLVEATLNISQFFFFFWMDIFVW